ncbi:MAG: VWA domain-containing protein [Gemmatales bacterium]|nr:VWA domain-containing protein [Gemmatales bacterium]MDW7993397.1 VWA domain-containing protein [Gemmatales bacterium]
MPTRRRQSLPPFFNLSLLDVVCNALGAIIFLMFLNYWQANHVSHRLQASLLDLATKEAALTQRENALQETRQQLSQLLDKLESAQKQLATTEQHLKQTELALSETEKARLEALQTAEELRLQLRSERQVRQHYQQVAQAWEKQARDLETLLRDAVAQLRQRVHEREHLAAQLHQTHLQIAQLSASLKMAEMDRQTLHQRLRSLQAQAAEFFHALQVRQTQIEDLQTRLSALERERLSALSTAGELQKQLTAVTTREKTLAEKLSQLLGTVEALSRQHEQLAQERDDLLKRLALQRTENQRLSEQLVLAQRQLGEAQQQGEKLRALLQQAQARFAGVDLSGRRAVFLVDTSGSMGKRDPYTDDPNKWPKVCETVRHVLLSMPHLEQLQLITFASSVSYPLGRPGQWWSFDRDYSPMQVLRALQALRPEGGTNLHLGFQEAFRFRDLGMDTIILFSDGLPTESPDLTPEEQRLENKEREQRLAPRLLKRIAEWNAPRGNPPRRVRIHAIGFYYDSPNLGNFLWALARQNDGSFVGMSEP